MTSPKVWWKRNAGFAGLGGERVGVLETFQGNYSYDANFERTELLWKCLACGELKPRNRWVLGDCLACGAPKSQFVLVDED
jgi:hypothetical protein